MKLVDDDTSDTVAEYQYDGANRRTVQKSYAGGVLDETRHLYYTQPSQWQVVEERVDAETDPDRQFVWGLRYIDDLRPQGPRHQRRRHPRRAALRPAGRQLERHGA